MKIAIRKILCPVDFSENAEHALRHAIAFAQAHDAALLLLHVVQPPVLAMPGDPIMPSVASSIMDDLAGAANEQLAALLERVRGEWERTASRLATGAPFLEIIRVAQAEGTDLIVMGTHGRSGLAHMLIGSVAEKVVRKAPCAVLTVKHPQHEFVMPG